MATAWGTVAEMIAAVAAVVALIFAIQAGHALFVQHEALRDAVRKHTAPQQEPPARPPAEPPADRPAARTVDQPSGASDTTPTVSQDIAGHPAGMSNDRRLQAADDHGRAARQVCIYETPVRELDDPLHREVFLRTPQHEALYDFRVIVIDSHRETKDDTRPILTPRSHPYRLATTEGLLRESLDAMIGSGKLTADHVAKNAEFGLSVTFRDAGNQCWQRLPDGTLILLQDPEDRTPEAARTRALENWDPSSLCP